MDREFLEREIERLRKRLESFEGHVLRYESEFFHRLQEDLKKLERELFFHHHPHRRAHRIEIVHHHHHHSDRHKGDRNMQQGPIVLTDTNPLPVSIAVFAQDGSQFNPSDPDFAIAAALIAQVQFSIDQPSVATVGKSADGTTNQVQAVANGTANLSASVTSAEGVSLTDTDQVTVNLGNTPPPTRVAASIKIVSGS